MKRVKCCTACRRRHRKCVTQPGASQCGTCLESGQECRFENDIRFKHTHAEGQKESGRKWAKVPQKISFTTPRGIDGKVPEESDVRPEANESATQPISEGMMEISIDDLKHTQSEAGPLDPASNYWESPLNFITDSPVDRNMIPVYQSDHPDSSSLPRASIPYILDSETSPHHIPTQGLATQGHNQDPFELTEREAFLFMTYIHKLAPLSDACDDARHFALEVPRLALHQPMIMNGLLALASRYDSRCTNSSDDIESTFYHNKCIKLLIEAFAQPPETWDSTLLTAVVIARLYEENDNETDSYYHHLSGTQNLLNHEAIARFVMQGGLAEAASWVHLRQAIYVYVVRREPLEICLENFERSTVFRRSDDSAYANRAVYNFAKLMRLFLPMESPDGDLGKWEAVEREMQEWYEARPVSFKPIFHKAADISSDRPFSVICFAASVPVVAMQHYYASKAVLCLRDSKQTTNNHRRQEFENNISSYLCMLMGLALSNSHVANAFYLPAHMLSLCGYCIRDPCVRTHTIQYLEKVDEVIKWKTKALIGTLKREWNGQD
ncbi:hypothetical protein FOXG_10703 [Fusarium oxysporum f. sp. lycopersici 4287]|uniref:Zn(2)-C6 fungal-type domain-containing protein n=1 Tax=Fusarium oxysporum f. sp. lycopersici (strain 4287 / CBS 123668 / FGSC 9935 / NRRL 34936) TaxID=426428 RepID=A0A0J9VH04_FUSO4|nr:hypothetical protein FOXG_10703 [Fusarium oxysporum f. sp. lycopersici 4287]XP_018248574.1 hypothetical protein FOXG_10703 [Fusarium oxysporum f. sp. lycopersici 4287]KNB10528.1 hypothetical protein FOXG_10703 [Fusarium oxysporum f. sp. lycopersici 4287]KNB10529.1 hypothetical protein FOXG_10703 [Fusarium oxysporum f. sp. lycopersici 4287]